MKAQWKTPWIEALRSGLYRQERQFLKVVNDDGTLGYCCLGVLQDVCSKAGTVISEDNESYLLDREKAPALLGLSMGEQEALSTMNDEGESFESIACYIEQFL